MLLPHRLEIRSSHYLALVLALLHLAALGSLLSLQIPVWLKLALTVAIVASLGVSIRRHALLQEAASISGLVLKGDGTVEGLRRDGGRFDARVSGHTTDLSLLIVILLELPESRRLCPLVFLPDSLPLEDARVLRAWLRWKLT
jgi:hypothetical protein